MGLKIGDLILKVLADDAGFEADLTKKAGKAGDAAAKTLGQRIKAGLSPERIGLALGAVFGGIAGAGVRMGEKVDAALDAIRAGTGATGAALKGLEDDFKAVSSRVPDDLEAVGQAIADLNKRTGQTGKGLQDLATSLLDVSRLTKTDVSANVRNATRLFGDWSIATEDQAATLDKVFRASQATGIGFDALMETVVDFGSPLRLLGFGFEESIALLGKWEKEGVNTETGLTGLKFAVKTLAAEGVPASDMARVLQERIASIGKSADPVGDSLKLFGLRAGPDLAAAILEGRFAIEDLLEVILHGTETIPQATNDTQDLGEAFRKFGNWVSVNFGGMFTAFAGLGNLVYIFPVVGGAFGKMAGKMIGSSGKLRGALETLALKGMYAGDALSSGLAGAWGKVTSNPKVIGAIDKAGGFMGSKLGKAFGVGLAAAAIIGVIETVRRIEQETAAQQAGIEAQVAQQIAAANAEGLRQTKAALEQGIRDLRADSFMNIAFPTFTQEQVDVLTKQLANVDEALGNTGSRITTESATITTATATLGTRGAAGFTSIADAAKRARDAIKTHADIIATRISALTATLLGEATALINGYYDPIIAQDELRVLKDTVAADTIARNATKAGTAERRQADLTLANSRKNLDQTRLNLLAAGQLSAKEQKAWLGELEKKYKTATGTARTEIGKLIAKIKELQNIPRTVVTISASISTGKIARLTDLVTDERAAGGPVTAGRPYLVNEHTPNSEVWVPDVSGTVLGPSATPAGSGSGSGFSPQITIYNPEPRAAEADIGRVLRRAAALGMS